MKNIAFGQYYPADSVIHRMDPRAKLIIAILCIVCTFLCKNALCFLALSLAVLLLAALSRIPIRLILSTIKPLIFILAFTSLFNVFGTQGAPENLLTPESWRIRIYEEGLWNALFMILRIVILLASPPRTYFRWLPATVPLHSDVWIAAKSRLETVQIWC